MLVWCCRSLMKLKAKLCFFLRKYHCTTTTVGEVTATERNWQWVPKAKSRDTTRITESCALKSQAKINTETEKAHRSIHCVCSFPLTTVFDKLTDINLKHLKPQTSLHTSDPNVSVNTYNSDYNSLNTTQ